MIPVCEPYLSGKELEYVSDCLKTNWISSQGKYIELFENAFASYCGCKYGIATTSGTTALHLALASLGIGKDDEVIIPAFTMIACAFAVVYTGATPVLVDAVEKTWCIDITKIEEKITKRTKAIMPVHIYGHPCDMDPLMDLANKHKLYVIEDAAEAHGAEYKGRKTGGIGHANCFSFYANKIITTGEGGMVVTNDNAIADKARSLKNLSFPLGKRTYQHKNVGFNYRMTNLQAAIGLAQFEKIEELLEMRRKNARLYSQRLKDIPGLTLPVEKNWAKNIYWMYGVLVQDEFGVTRDDLINRLKKEGIDTREFFVPIHQQPVFIEKGLFQFEHYPVAEDIGRRGLYLPSSSGLRDEHIDYVCTKIMKIKECSV